LRGPIRGFWGKLDTVDGAVLAWHPLADHCADVAACCEALLSETTLGTRLAALGGLKRLSTPQLHRLATLATLHDIGKFSVGFQNKALAIPPFRCGHLREVAGLLGKDYSASAQLSEALGAEELSSWGDSLLDLLVATISHHGRPIGMHLPIHPAWWEPSRGLDPFAGIADLVARTRAWFPEAWGEAGEPLPDLPGFEHAWSGLVTLADWIGSDSDRFFPFSEEPGADRMVFARLAASEALGKLGLAVGSARRSLGESRPAFDRIAPGLEPRPAQAALLDLAPEPACGSVALLEAETGSGKTEAALAYFARLFHAGRVEGMYFALPTRTAATQIYRRVRAAIEHAFPERQSRPAVVLAVPGYLEVDGVGGTRFPPFRVLWNDDREERLRYRGWAAEHPKRYLAGTVVVGTVDQVLLSSLMVSHSHMRATALLRHLLVVDEVHASDAYMTRILEDVLDRHLLAGGHALLMSATLGAAARERLLAHAGSRAGAVVPDAAGAVACAYPLVSFRQGDRRLDISVAGDSARQKHVELLLAAEIDEPAAIARRALAAARLGARVLVVRNTVAGCLQTQAALEELAALERNESLLFRCRDLAAPHHARYAKPDRELLDEALESAFGKERPWGGCVAAATQTVQQSLDLDADLLLTDLCPMDVLLQRIGRLHRHFGRRRPCGCEVARIVVLVPAEPLANRIRPGGEPSGDHGLGTVYEDLRSIESTWRELVRSSEISIPADNRKLVEAATHPQNLTALVNELGEPWPAHAQCMLGRLLADRRQGGLNLVRRDLHFASEPSGGGVEFPSGDSARRIPTRLGEDDRLVRFEPPLRSPFDAAVFLSDLSIPYHLVARGTRADAAVAETVKPLGEGFEFNFGPCGYRYDRLGLRPKDLEPLSEPG
jgi:CRISPR-associated endonuclease/helicase Cas3